jgi:hypothetical protein
VQFNGVSLFSYIGMAMKKNNLFNSLLLAFSFIVFNACLNSDSRNVNTNNLVAQGGDTIPFKLTNYNNLIIQGIFNKVDTLDLMFHLAVGNVSITTEGLSKAPSIQMDQSASVSSWGGSRKSGYSSNHSFQIAGYSWDSIGITESERSGHFSDGKFGYNFWEDKVLVINFDDSQIILFDSLQTISEDYQMMDIEFDGSSMFINGQIAAGDSLYQHKFMIHSGYSGLAMLDDAFVESHKINEKLKTIKESTLHDSYGNALVTKTVVTPELSIGDIKFTNVPIGTFSGEIKRQSMSVLGGDALKRFNMIFDFQNHKLYLQPNKNFDSPYFDRVG